MKKVHSFQQSQNTARIGEDLIQRYLENKYETVLDVTKTKKFQKVDVDYVAITDSRVVHLYEVKTDTYTARNGNIFLETWSNKEKQRKGWPFYTKCSHLVYVPLGLTEIYVFDGARILELVELFREEGEVKQVWNTGYSSEGIVYPLQQIPSSFYETVQVEQ